MFRLYLIISCQVSAKKQWIVYLCYYWNLKFFWEIIKWWLYANFGKILNCCLIYKCTILTSLQVYNFGYYNLPYKIYIILLSEQFSENVNFRDTFALARSSGNCSVGDTLNTYKMQTRAVAVIDNWKWGQKLGFVPSHVGG